MICQCFECGREFDSKDEGYIMPILVPEKARALVNHSRNYEEKAYCEDCFTEILQCYDCGGFKNKFAMAVYDGSHCECD